MLVTWTAAEGERWPRARGGKAEPPYPDRLGHAFHDLPAEEAWVGLALLLPPADHVPPIGLLVGARVQKPLEVQAMLLQPKSIYDTVPAETERTGLPGTSLHSQSQRGA